MIKPESLGDTVISVLLVYATKPSSLIRHEYRVRLIDVDSPVLTRPYSSLVNVNDLIRDFLNRFVGECDYTFIFETDDIKYYVLHH
jgi:hypothetical protein